MGAAAQRATTVGGRAIGVAFRAVARASGWQPIRAWTDPEALFSLHLLENQG